MDKPVCESTSADTELVDLGEVLGENRTFGLIAGRCSAAQAASLRRLREERKYLRISASWDEFCSTRLRVSKAFADKMIRLLDEFGPDYFGVAQFTQVSAETYRELAPSIKDGMLHANGEAIELNSENSRKIAAAISELRRHTAAPRKPPRQLEPHERIARLAEQSKAIVKEFEALSATERHSQNWLRFVEALTELAAALHRLQLQNNLV
jgi:hypothetical protein